MPAFYWTWYNGACFLRKKGIRAEHTSGPRKAERFEKMLEFDNSHSIVTRGSMGLLCATTCAFL